MICADMNGISKELRKWELKEYLEQNTGSSGLFWLWFYSDKLISIRLLVSEKSGLIYIECDINMYFYKQHKYVNQSGSIVFYAAGQEWSN